MLATRSVVLWLVGVWISLVRPACGEAGQWTLRLKLEGRALEGTPLAWSQEQVYLLGRDGHLWNFAPAEAEAEGTQQRGFRSYSQNEMRGRLQREFGPQFDVSGTGHYLVVHPAGQRDQWASRFEQLYRSFVHYFTVRGFALQPPRFPLVAVVFARQQDFQRQAAAEGAEVGAGVLGYYSPVTNRIMLYDVTEGSGAGGDWHVNAETIIHEAAHQVAFNTGVHSRWALPPRWVAEGLGTMFEAPGVWDGRHHRLPQDRVHRRRLKAFQTYAASRYQTGGLAELVASDRLFQTDLEGAYAAAWALTFFLAETQPRTYMQYLARTASRDDFQPYRGPERLNDFTDLFGQDLRQLEARWLRYLAELPH